MRIALLEDDPDQANLYRHWIESQGYDCHVFENAGSFLRTIHRESFDLLVTDWILPDRSGVDVVRWLRTHLDWAIPIIFVTRKHQDKDVVEALEAGADDFMIKPIRPSLLAARIRAVSRRSRLEETDPTQTLIVDFPGYRFHTGHQSIAVDGQVVDTTQREYELALFLFRNAGRILSRGHILETVWGLKANINTRTVDTHVSRVRTKLELKGEHGWQLVSIYQHGYRLQWVRDETGQTDEPIDTPGPTAETPG